MSANGLSERLAPLTLTHLQRLEAESIHIMREVAAEARHLRDRPGEEKGPRLSTTAP